MRWGPQGHTSPNSSLLSLLFFHLLFSFLLVSFLFLLSTGETPFSPSFLQLSHQRFLWLSGVTQLFQTPPFVLHIAMKSPLKTLFSLSFWISLPITHLPFLGGRGCNIIFQFTALVFLKLPGQNPSLLYCFGHPYQQPFMLYLHILVCFLHCCS